MTQTNHYFEGLVTLLIKSGRQKEAETWRVRWFEAWPSLELFATCLDAVPIEGRALQAEQWISRVRSLGDHWNLLIDMYLHLNDPDGAWQVYLEDNRSWVFDGLSDSARRLFETSKEHDPMRIVPILRQFAEKRIQEKNRFSYQRAATWLTELEIRLWPVESNRGMDSRYILSIRGTYRRLPALQDELVKGSALKV